MEDQSKLVGELIAALKDVTERLAASSLPLVLTKKEAARQLGVKRTRLDAFINSGQLGTFRYEATGHPYILASELMRFIAERSATSAVSKPMPKPPRARRIPRARRVVDVSAEAASLRAELRKARRHR